MTKSTDSYRTNLPQVDENSITSIKASKLCTLSSARAILLSGRANCKILASMLPSELRETEML